MARSLGYRAEEVTRVQLTGLRKWQGLELTGLRK